MDKSNNMNNCITCTSGGLNVSYNNTRKTIEITNNKAEYYAGLASQYKEEARELMELAKYYAEQNSDVTISNIRDLESRLLAQISLKQDLGDYVLTSTLEEVIDNLTSSPDYVDKTDLDNAINEVRLPEQSGNADKLLATDGEQAYWTNMIHDHIPLFSGMYFDNIPNNPSWIIAGGQAVSGDIYEFAYNELVNEITSPKYGLKVVEISNMASDTDYSYYWKINQTDRYFICPTKISYSPITETFALSSEAKLYFKLANAVNNIELLNAGEVLETVNSIIPVNSELISGFSMPSNRHIELTLGANGSTYTAPANGWFAVFGHPANISGYFTFTNDTALFTADSKSNSGNYAISTNICCKKGDRVAVYYNYSPFSSAESGTPHFRFIYAEGN